MKNAQLSSNFNQNNFSDLFSRLFFVLFAIVIFRMGSFVPIPGVDASVLSDVFSKQKETILGMFNMFSGGALERASVFALGIMPYISASIIMQLLSIIHEPLAEIKKEGESGRAKISQYTRFLALFLACLQAVGISIGLPNMFPGLVPSHDASFYVLSTISLVTGTMFLMWLGEQINERGIGNGISILIVAGIIAGIPSSISILFEQVSNGSLNVLSLFALTIIVLALIYLIVFAERGQRRVIVNYPKQAGSSFARAKSSHLPLKINMSGVIPPIFASSIILFPGTLMSWFGNSEYMGWLSGFVRLISPGQPLYSILYVLAIIFFCFFYTAIVFNSRETAENLKKSGAFLTGIRPGQQTASHLDRIITRLTMSGAIYISFVCLLPELMMTFWGINFILGGTSLLIVVVVVMDFMSQIQTYIISNQYSSVMKKANLINSNNKFSNN